MRNYRKAAIIVVNMLFVLLLITGCSKPSKEEQDNIISTSVVETLNVGRTRTAIARPTDTPIPSPTMVPTSTQVPTIAQPTFDMTAIYGITQSPVPNLTQVAATPTMAAGVKERADWARSVPADGTLIDGGAKFTVQVTIINNGNTTWTTEYYIQHVDGPKMGAKTKWFMPAEISPSKAAIFEIEFTGPTEPGTYRSNWAVYNANNVVIGNFYFEYMFD